MIFSLPLALFSLTALAALAAVYLFRNRFRKQQISSLILWTDHRQPKQGGIKLTRLQTPLLFLLELLILLLLALASAGPMIRSRTAADYYVFVLDDSFSMQAGQPSPKDKAIQFIKETIADSSNFQATILTASQNTQILAEKINNPELLKRQLENWNPDKASSDIPAALNTALPLAGKQAKILILTDHKPQLPLTQGRVRWQSFAATPAPNLAFTAASRKTINSKDRCVIAVTNFSENQTSFTYTLTNEQTGQTLQNQTIQLNPKATHRSVFNLDNTAAPVRASIKSDNDSLAIDNEVLLLPQTKQTLRIGLNIKNDELLKLIKHSLTAAGSTELASFSPHIYITDSNTPAQPDPQTWLVNFTVEPNAPAYAGPFVLDSSHPLAEGLEMSGIIWAAHKKPLPGSPVITAGSVPLITERANPFTTRQINFNFNPALSNLQLSANWPILIYNLLEYRRKMLPGPTQKNYRLTDSVELTTPKEQTEIEITNPLNQKKTITSAAENIIIQTDNPGIYQIKITEPETEQPADTEQNTKQYEFAVNPIAPDESDLTQAAAGSWGKWAAATLFWWQYKPLDWLLLLTALAMLTAHRILTNQQRKGTM